MEIKQASKSKERRASLNPELHPKFIFNVMFILSMYYRENPTNIIQNVSRLNTVTKNLFVIVVFVMCLHVF